MRAEAMREPEELTPEQNSLLTRLGELQAAEDRLGMVALEDKAKALAEEVQGNNRSLAGKIYGVLGHGFESTGDYARACKMHEQEMAAGLALGDRAGVARASCNLGACYHHIGDYSRARVLHEQDRAICEELGDRVGVARACGNLGNCYYSTGDYARARDLHEQSRGMCEEMGDLEGVAKACSNMGNIYFSTGDYVRARELHEQKKAMCEASGDRAGVAMALCNLGNCYDRTGDYARARELHEQHKAICEALGDRVGVSKACCNLGNCYHRTGDNVRARVMNQLSYAISEELGDRPGVIRTCGNIGKICLRMGDYGQAISCFTQQYNMAKEMEIVPDKATASLCIGVALRLEVQGHPASASACRENGMREAEKWLQTALQFGNTPARLHLARLALDAGQEDSALQYLQDYLSWYVQRGRNECAGCYQTRGEHAQMLTCGGCRVARFCSVDHQKMASKSVASGGCLLLGRHSDVCGLLGKWRLRVVKECGSPEKLRADLLAFLSK